MRHSRGFVLAAATAAAALLSTPAAAQSVPAAGATVSAPDSAGVRRAVLDYVEGFYEGDTTKLVRSVWRDAHKYGFWRAKDSTGYAAEAMPWSEIIGYAKQVKARGKPTPASAPKVVHLFEVQDQTASAKLTAWWGTDYLLLGRIDGRWMITHVLWQSSPPAVAAR
jgi:Putative lumazine-binding